MLKKDTEKSEMHPAIYNAGREGSGDHIPLISLEDVGPLAGAAMCLFMLIAITYYVFFQPSPFQRIYDQFSENAKKTELVEKAKQPAMMPVQAVDADSQAQQKQAAPQSAAQGR